MSTRWLRMYFKSPKQKVFAQVNEQGEFENDRGRVYIRYRLNDKRSYLATVRNLKPIPGEEIQESEVEVIAAPPKDPTKKSAAKKAPSKAKKSSSQTSSSAPTGAPPTSPADGTILIFTDGACSGNPGPCGLGAVLLYAGHRKEIFEYLGEGTNNLGELTAILRALQAVNTPLLPVHLYTDSSYSIGVLSKGWKAKVNRELITEIKEEMTRFEDLSLLKVKGHSGHPLNERADELACEAVDRKKSATVDHPPG